MFILNSRAFKLWVEWNKKMLHSNKNWFSYNNNYNYSLYFRSCLSLTNIFSWVNIFK
jgi:hypothetical protein